jgi:transmembrane sensor
MSDKQETRLAYTDAQRREAAEWFVLIRDEDDPAAETIRSWSRWLDETEGNKMAFEAVVRTWHSLPTSPEVRMPSAQEVALDAYDGEEPLASWLETRRPARAPLPGRGRYGRLRLIAACLVGVAILGVVMSRYFDSHQPADEFLTKTGEQLELTLTDGSHVWLGAKSKLSVEFTQKQRVVRLGTGEAFFTVKKDRARPFIVRAPQGDITAVGTAFDVRAVADRVTVAVSEGIVRVVPETGTTGAAREVHVASGQQVIIDPRGRARSLNVTQSENPGERARWREGMLVYRDEALKDVAADVSRYTDAQLQIDDPAVAEMRYTGVIYKNAANEWATALPESFPVSLVQDGDRIRITAR